MDYRKIFAQLSEEVKPAALMAVSKTRSLEEIQQAYEAGFRLFGENHVQEIVEKFSLWKPEDLELHMIGHLQSNKVNKVVPIVDMIESVDSFELLEKINNCAARNNKVIKVLLEFNTSGEDAKSGFVSKDELLSCIKKAHELDNVLIAGLMTVGPVKCSPEKKDLETAKAFSLLASLFEECRKTVKSDEFRILSMGMSGDYKIGLQYGSTEVRIGTAIFGERFYA